MRSAIKPEGWTKGTEVHYAHAAYGGHYLSCPFSPFRMKINRKIKNRLTQSRWKTFALRKALLYNYRQTILFTKV